MWILLFSIVAFVLFFGLLSIRMWMKNEYSFRGTCASASPFLQKEGGSCGYCGKAVTEDMSCGRKK